MIRSCSLLRDAAPAAAAAGGGGRYREWGWAIFEAIERECRTPIGYAGTTNVYRRGSLEDSEPSFWMAEVLKYAYLLVSDDSALRLDEWVLNTEAHPVRITRTKLGFTPPHAGSAASAREAGAAQLHEWCRRCEGRTSRECVRAVAACKRMYVIT